MAVRDLGGRARSYIRSPVLFIRRHCMSKPNVVLIMADDMGFECLSCYGSTSYKTPVLDGLATRGLQ